MVNSQQFKSIFYPLLLGLLAYWFIVGFKVLDPEYIGWLLGRFDSVQHYLGWVFFRHSDWSNPIGMSPTFGLDISSSIVYSDSVPLMAIIFKSFDKYLPTNFQYFGIWLLICFVLQAYFGWKLASMYFQSSVLRLLVAAIFILSPQMLWRLNTHAGVHNALASHFLILAGIFLVLRKDDSHRFLFWIILFVASLSINFYFLLITSMLWMADSIDRYLQKSIALKKIISELFLLLAIVLFLAWEVGYFAISTSSVDIWGYGFFRFNLLAPIDSYGYSFWFPNMNLPSTWGEGYAYFGLGALLALLLSIPFLFTSYSEILGYVKQHFTLVFIIFLFLLLSVTNNVGIGNENYLLVLPEPILKLLGIVHSAARFFWPVYYFLIIFSVFAIKSTYPKKYTLPIFILIVALQFIDLVPLYRSIRTEYSKDMSSLIQAPALKHALWQIIGKKYKNLVLIPAENQPADWANFAIYSANHGLGTNSIFTARIDSMKVLKSNEKLNALIENGNYDVQTVYIVKDSYVLPVLMSANESSIMVKLDGLNVFLPNWEKCIDCPTINVSDLITLNSLAPRLNEVIDFSTSNLRAAYYLDLGWSWMESWGVWSDAQESKINFLSPKGATKITLLVRPFVVPVKKPTQSVKVFINGGSPQTIEYGSSDVSKIIIPIIGSSDNNQPVKIRFVFENLLSPKVLDIGNDDVRILGLGLISATFE